MANSSQLGSAAVMTPRGKQPGKPRPRHRFQFSLRTTLLVTLGLSLVAGYLVQGVRDQLRIATIVERLGGDVSLAIPDTDHPGDWRPWFRHRLPPELLYPVTGISLAYADCRPQDLAVLRRCRNLQRLDLDFCPIGDAGTEHLQMLTNLRWLDLQQTGITDAGVLRLSSLSNLHSLILEQNPISDASVPALGKLKRLKYLRIGETAISPAGYEQLRRELPDCRIVR